MKSLALACNPAIEDFLITSRDQAMRIIDANYGLYASQLRELFEESQSMIHIVMQCWQCVLNGLIRTTSFERHC